MDFQRKKLLNLIRKQNNKNISTDKKQIKSHQKKMRKLNNKLLFTCQSNNINSTSPVDCKGNPKENTHNFYELELKVLRKELVSSRNQKNKAS